MLAVALSIPAHAQNAEETLQLADQYVVLKKQNEKLKQEVLDREQELTALQNKEKELKAKLKSCKKDLILAIKAERDEILRQLEEINEKRLILVEKSYDVTSASNYQSDSINNDLDFISSIADDLIKSKYIESTVNGYLKYLELYHPEVNSNSIEKLRRYDEYNNIMISFFDETIRDTNWKSSNPVLQIENALSNNEYYKNCYKQADKSIPYLDKTIDDFKEIIQYGFMSKKIIDTFVKILKFSNN